jgi:hypothetical protein
MPYVRGRRARGLGANWQIGSAGTPIDCDSWSNLFQGVCWNPTAPGLPSQTITDPSTGVQSVVPVLPTPGVVMPPTTPILDVPSTAISSLTSGIPWVWIVGGAVLFFGMVALGGGGPRRYGR